MNDSTAYDLDDLSLHSMRHGHRILAATRCGCYYCFAIFAPNEIREWADDRTKGHRGLSGRTACCPRCGIDSVLPDDLPGVQLTTELLREIGSRAFRISGLRR